MVILRKLTESDAEAFQRAYEATAATDPRFAPGFDPDEPFATYLALLNDYERGLRLPENHVPSTMYWAILGDALAGRLMLRHLLNDRLRQTGGNIGYVVVPAYRGRGIATEMLRLALPFAMQLGLDRVLITCDETNAASRRVAEKCGGILEGTSVVPETGVVQVRYWIALR